MVNLTAEEEQATRRRHGMRSSLVPTLEDFEVTKAAIFDLVGTLLDSVDPHAIA